MKSVAFFKFKCTRHCIICNSLSKYNTVRQYFYMCGKFMRICQNGTLVKFMQFLFMHSSALCIVTYGAIKNLCDQRLTLIIKSHTEICRFRVL